MKYLIFNLGENTFGISIDKVRELVKFKRLRRLSQMPKWLSGIVSYRRENYGYVRLWEILKTPPPEKEIILFLTGVDLVSFGIGDLAGIKDISVKGVSHSFLRLKYIEEIGDLNGNIVLIISPVNLVGSRKINTIKQLLSGKK